MEHTSEHGSTVSEMYIRAIKVNFVCPRMLHYASHFYYPSKSFEFLEHTELAGRS